MLSMHNNFYYLVPENYWMSGKLKSLDFKKRQDIVEFKLSDISITRQSELVGVARSGIVTGKQIGRAHV